MSLHLCKRARLNVGLQVLEGSVCNIGMTVMTEQILIEELN